MNQLPATTASGRYAARDSMLLTTSDCPSDRTIQRTLGLAYGNTIRARNVGRDILAKLKGLVGGEIDDYTKMLAQAREQALDRLAADARGMGANAVVGLRFGTAEVMQGAAEILAYGTAVILDDPPPAQ